MPDAIDIYNAIGAKFDPLEGSSTNTNSRWEFQFDQNKNQVFMNAYVDNREVMVMGGCSPSLLTSSLNKNDVSQIIQWLFKVKSCLKD